MSQLIENKQNHPVLIANFEPNEIARKSEEKTKIQTRKYCAGNPAQKVTSLSRANESSRALLQTRLLQLPGFPAIIFLRLGWLWRGLRLRFLGRLRNPLRRRNEFVCRNG